MRTSLSKGPNGRIHEIHGDPAYLQYQDRRNPMTTLDVISCTYMGGRDDAFDVDSV